MLVGTRTLSLKGVAAVVDHDPIVSGISYAIIILPHSILYKNIVVP